MPAVCTGSVTAVWHSWPTRARSFSSPRAPVTLAHRRSRVRLAASPTLVRCRIPAGALSTRGRSSARLRLSGPPGGPPPRSRLLDRSSKGVAKPCQCVERSYGHCRARMERCNATVAAAWLQLPLLHQGAVGPRTLVSQPLWLTLASSRAVGPAEGAFSLLL